MKTTRFLVDCHTHLNWYLEDSSKSAAEVAHALFADMAKHGVDHAVVLTSYKINDHRPSIEQVIDLVGGDPRITLVEGLRWRGDDGRTDLFELEARIGRGEVKGIKLYPGYDHYAINDPSLEGVFRIAAKHAVPVMIHTGDTYSKQAKVRHAHPLLVDDVAVDYPDVQFLMCHLGNPWFEDAAEVLYKNDNVYADVSGLTLGQFSTRFEEHILEKVRNVVTYMGDPEKQLLYGSDWPLVDMGSYLDFFDDLELSPEARERVAWGTAAELFGIELEARTTPSGS